MADPNPNYYERPYELVSGQIAQMSQRADQTLNQANSVISSLTSLSSEIVTGSTPKFTLPDLILDKSEKPAAPAVQLFGELQQFQLPEIDDLAVGTVDAGEVPTFSPSAVGLQLPAAPTSIDTSGKPLRPALDGVTLPDAPSFVQPDLEDLTPITVPEFVFPELPAFDGTQPTFTAAPPSTVLSWSEPVYASTVLDDVKARIRAMLAGGTGIPPAIELALFERARGREDLTALKATQEAFDTFAARGFEMPPGMLVAQVNAQIEANQLQANALSREILAKAAEWEIENLRNAVQQGVALEGVLINAFMNMAQRAFEAARYRVEAEVSLFNAKVALFNAEQNAYSVAAQVYKTRIDGALAKLEVFKAQIQATQAIGQLNEQKVKVFSARLDALRNQVEIYKARMSGAQVQADINRAVIEGYRADVQAYAEDLQAQKIKFDAYKTQVEGETAKVQVLDAEARAFAATVQAYEGKANVKVKEIESRIEAIRASTERFRAKVEAEREKVQSSLAAIQARAQSYSTDVSRYSAELNNSTELTRVKSGLLEARLRNNLAFYEINLKEYDANMARLLEEAKLKSDGAKAAGTMAAQLAAGAMAALHVQASMSGSANISSSESTNTNISL